MLTKDDWQDLDVIILELHSVMNSEEFEIFVLQRLSQFLGAKFASWNIHNSQMFLESVTNTPAFEAQVEPLVPALNRTLPTHPLFQKYLDFETGKVCIVDTVERLLDHISEEEFRLLPFYTEVANVLEIKDQLLMHISVTGGQGILLTFHGNQEFTPAQHMKASIMRGHILARHHTLQSQIDAFHKQVTQVRTKLESLMTNREMESMILLCKGMSNSEIAGEMNISENTVNKFVTSILKKLSMDSRTRVIAKYSGYM